MDASATDLHPKEKRCDPNLLNWPKKPGDEERHLSKKRCWQLIF
jgi:hypothetical protein